MPEWCVDNSISLFMSLLNLCALTALLIVCLVRLRMDMANVPLGSYLPLKPGQVRRRG